MPRTQQRDNEPPGLVGSPLVVNQRKRNFLSLFQKHTTPYLVYCIAKLNCCCVVLMRFSLLFKSWKEAVSETLSCVWGGQAAERG